MKKKLSIALAVTVIAPFGLIACGDDEESTSADSAGTEESSAGGSTVSISAVPDGSFAYEQDSAEAEAGSVTIEFDNPATLGHDVQVEGPDGNIGGTDVIAEDTTTATVELEPGDYTFYCSVAGHREGGMEGDLTVE
ncbi:MAG: plastocyanin/azurin family copper-binding protein [Actinomycetota bacterium]|nr:plastocyanin/azurin family copper-binding protein [Actinomycetota bacterium]